MHAANYKPETIVLYILYDYSSEAVDEYTCMHTCRYAYKYTCKQTCTYAYMHTHICTYACTYAYMHTNY